GVIFTRSQENLSGCGQDGGNYHDPWITEGFLGALCRDIEDSGAEDNWDQASGAPGSDGFGDVLSMGTNEIFDIADSVNPDDTSDFIWGFKAAYPNIAENLWETAMENDYDLDTANPSAPTNMSSSSHPVGTDSPDATPTFSWTRSTDDASGVGGYGVYITSSCSTPGQTQDIGDVTSWTSPALSPGTYYFNLRAVDRSGRWGSSSCYGPFTIREPEPANLEFTTPSGWNYSVVPRETDDASSGSAPNPVLLEGNTASTYWNLRGKNSGESSTSVGFTSLLTLDGSNQGWWASWSSIGSGGGFYGTNMGPANIPGGRHTYGSILDSDDVIAETDETDNRYAAQWIWSPYDLSEDLAVTRSAPPEMEGGWDDNVGVNWYNCDGFRFSSSSWWNAVLLTATDNADDYDCRLHEASTGAEDGFSTNLGYASRSAGYIDALIVNRNTVGNQNWDVGVLNESGGSSDFEITHVTESSHSYGDSLNVTMEDGEYLILREVGITASNVGPLSITLQVDPSEGPIHMRWYDEAFETGNLNASSEYDGTDSNGLARIDVEVTESGYYGLAIYRNPLDVNRGAVTFTVEVDLTPPDFLPYQFAGWHSPLVPRPADDGTNDSVALPDTLYGNEASTYLNIGVHNESPTGADGLLGKVYFDGVYSYWLAYPYFPGNANSPFNWSHAHTVRGGRHTLSLRLDDDETIEEISEENNIYGEQYVWSPLLLEDGVPLNRSIPPDRIGGWDEAPDGTSLWYNCDGLRLPNSGWWRAAAVLPSAGEDVDIRLHSALSGVKEGFKGSLAYSGWGPNSTDFVMANFNSVTNQSLDLGVLRIGDASGDYLAETVKSDYMGLNPAGTYSGFPLEDNRLLSLHEIGVSDSTYYGLRLVNHSDAKLGVSVYSADSDFRGKSQAMEGALAWLNGPGADEVITFTAAEAGYYCVAVWKAGAPDLHKTGTYDLHFVPGYQVDAGDAAPLGTGIAGVYPNPFNPKTTVRFTLKESAEAELAVYDIRGARVRQLQGGMLEAGSHHVEWDGKDSSGATVASGIYFIRLDAGGESYSRKAVLLK
ncbi:MAG: FlgD immunoglobulin-like domain containing protein, partial [Candidatus Krumholzibacteria bacterium]|nr:FlgD immunoglobulin-like domain containing protein [Candidatus Krumholzibacteria bacterium]